MANLADYVVNAPKDFFLKFQGMEAHIRSDMLWANVPALQIVYCSEGSHLCCI